VEEPAKPMLRGKAVLEAVSGVTQCHDMTSRLWPLTTYLYR